MDRVIFHCDCNGFFASVECLDNPSLRDVPMAVAGDEASRRGIILAKNERAKAYDVRTAETVWQAKRKCPNLVLVPPRHGRYEEVSKQVNALYAGYTDLIEPFGIDESWLDVTGSLALFGLTPEDLADRVRGDVKARIGITISVGVSFNKVFAKLGSDLKKPDATTVITRENFREKVWPLPVEALLYVGGAAKAALARQGVATIGELARADREAVERALGKGGGALWENANGLDDAPVKRMGARDPLKSVGNGMTFRRDLVGEAELRAGLTPLADEVATRLRRHGLKCRTVQVQIKAPSLQVISRQAALERPTNLQRDLIGAAMALIGRHWQGGAPVRALTLTATGLIAEKDAVEQLSFLDGEELEKRARMEKLEKTLDEIRGKFGGDSIALGLARRPDLDGADGRKTDAREEG